MSDRRAFLTFLAGSPLLFAFPSIAEAQVALANCHLDVNHREPARALLARARAIHAAHPELGEHLRRPLREAQARGL